MLLLGCAKEKQPTYLTVSDPGTITAEAQSLSLSVNCDVEWTASAEEGSWLRIEGKEASALMLSLPLNKSADSRSATVTVKAGKLMKEVTVTQNGLSSLIKPLSLNIRGTEPGRIDVNIRASWNVGAKSDWFTITKERSTTGTAYLLVTPADGNENVGERKSAITITFGGESVEIPVIQGQTDVLYADDSLLADGSEADYTIGTSTNVDYEVVIPAGASWISHVSTKALNERNTVIHLSENTTGETRSATITLKGGNAEKTFTIRQVFSHPVLDKTALGAYGLDGNDYAYREGKDQWSWRVRGGIRSFLLLDQEHYRVFMLGGIPEQLQLGTSFSGNVTLIDKVYTPVDVILPLTVVGADGDTFRLANGNGAGFIIRKK